MVHDEYWIDCVGAFLEAKLHLRSFTLHPVCKLVQPFSNLVACLLWAVQPCLLCFLIMVVMAVFKSTLKDMWYCTEHSAADPPYTRQRCCWQQFPRNNAALCTCMMKCCCVLQALLPRLLISNGCLQHAAAQCFITHQATLLRGCCWQQCCLMHEGL